VRKAFPAGGQGLRRWLLLSCTAIAFASLCPAAAAQLKLPDVKVQLPKVQVPLPDGAVGDLLPGDTVEQVVEEPLPVPVVEDLVQNSPVAPVRDEARRLTGGESGGGGGSNGGGSNGGGSNGAGGGNTQAGPATAGPQTGSNRGTGGNSGAGRRSSRGRAERRAGGGDGQSNARGDRPSARRGGAEGADPAGAASDGAGPAGRRAGENGRDDAGRDDSGNAVTRSIDRIVEVVPAFIWIALGLLSLIALALGGRAFVDRRRAKALEADREILKREVTLLERTLLPPVPERLGSLTASVAYRPAEGPAAGGDFYDALELPDGRVAVLVGDVSGHGPESLERTNTIRAELRVALEAGATPREALGTVGTNAPNMPTGMFATVVAAVHDPGTGTFTYATAGHPPPIVIGPGAHEPVTVASSLPIGIGLPTGLRQTTVTLEPGSVVCLFTDGLLEAHVGEEMLGRERLRDIVAGLDPEDGAEALLDGVIDAADEVSDDMAVCLLRATTAAIRRGVHVEELELDAGDVEAGIAERFLEAFGLSEDEVARTAAEVRAASAVAGRAVLRVTSNGHGVEPSVGDTDARPAAA
jgi:Stage II sporulation protein E (SpoIIE)